MPSPPPPANPGYLLSGVFLFPNYFPHGAGEHFFRGNLESDFQVIKPSGSAACVSSGSGALET